MKKHTKVYLDFFYYGIDDFIPCELCGSKSCDIHHLTKQSKFGKKKEKDYIENIIAVCRDCHDKCEHDDLFNCYARIKHLELVCSQVYAMIDLKKKLKNYEN
tara:strand:- start:22404 stop:22709 length:306 start_codon:yes stop_codon:yes gene_type:complete